MEIIYVDKDSPVNIGPIAATVGFFDGVHLGHRFLIDQLKTTARAKGLPSAVVTFPVHPRKVLDTAYCPELLNDFREKLYHLAATGIDYCIVIDFSKALSQLSAHAFIHRVLAKKLHVKELLVGYDHRFGKDRTEGTEEYIKYGREASIDVTKAEPLLVDNEYVSSTRIRKLLQSGDIRKSSQLLSYNYTLEGTVLAGDQLGRKLGFPTANIHPVSDKAIPSTGIYAIRAYTGNINCKGMLYIGARPTITDAGSLRIEAFLFDFSGDLYNQSLTIEFVDFLREDRKFESLEELVKQLEEDRKLAEKKL